MNIIKLEKAVREWNWLNDEEKKWYEMFEELDKARTRLRTKIRKIETKASRKANGELTRLNRVSDTYYRNYRKALEHKQKLSITQIAKLLGCRVNKKEDV